MNNTFMQDQKREDIVINFMAALLSNSSFMKYHLKTMGVKGILKKDDKFFTVISGYACQAADSVIKDVEKKY